MTYIQSLWIHIRRDRVNESFQGCCRRLKGSDSTACHRTSPFIAQRWCAAQMMLMSQRERQGDKCLWGAGERQKQWEWSEGDASTPERGWLVLSRCQDCSARSWGDGWKPTGGWEGLVWNDWGTLKEDGPCLLGLSVCTKIYVAKLKPFYRAGWWPISHP